MPCFAPTSPPMSLLKRPRTHHSYAFAWKRAGKRLRNYMLAKGKKCVNGKCVLLCTINENLWSIVTHSNCQLGILWDCGGCKSLKISRLNKVSRLPPTCIVIAE